MAQASVESGSQGTILKQSSVKFVQEIKKTLSKYDCELTLTENELTWKPINNSEVDGSAGKEEGQKPESKVTTAASTNAFSEESVRVVWIVKAQAVAPPPQNNGETPAAGEGTEQQSSDLIIHYVKRHELPAFRFSVAQVKFSGQSSICTEWETLITEHVAKEAPQRPKSLLVIINPVSGNKKGEKIYREKAEPVYQLFGIKTEIVVTTKPKESSEILEKNDLSKYDGLVSVGGDGTHTEVTSALQSLTMKAAGVEDIAPDTVLKSPSIRHGLIPTGSGNGQQLFGSYNRDILTNVIVIALGDSKPRSLMTIHCGEKLLGYSYLMVAYGLMSQIMEVMENNRWAGPARYLGAAFVTFIKRKAAEIQVDYLPGDEDSQRDWNLSAASKLPEVSENDKKVAGDSKKVANSTANKKTEENNTKPEDNKTEENKTKSEENKTKSEEDKNEAEGTNGGDEKKDEIETKEEKATDTEKKEEDKAPEADGNVTTTDKAEGATAEIKPAEVEDPLAEGWKRVRGRFLGLDCFLGRADKIEDFGRLYNSSHFNSGLIGMALTEPCGRLEHVKFMRRLQKGDMQRAYRDAGFINMIGVKAISVKAIGDWCNSSKANTIDWDGDVIYAPEPHFELRAHSQIAQTFARSDGEELKEICKKDAEFKERELEKKASQKKQNNTQNTEKAEQGKDKSPVTETKDKAATDGSAATKPEIVVENASKDEIAPPSHPEKNASDLPKSEVEITVTEAPEVAADSESQ